MARWRLEDTSTNEVYDFEVNPSAGGSPARRKNVVSRNTTAPEGNVVVFEGQRPPAEGEFSGTLLTQSQYEALADWYERPRPLLLTDDLGRTLTVYITEFVPERVRSANHPWKHRYTCRFLMLGTVA